MQISKKGACLKNESWDKGKPVFGDGGKKQFLIKVFYNKYLYFKNCFFPPSPNTGFYL